MTCTDTKIIYMSEGTPLMVSSCDYDLLINHKWYPSGVMRHASGRPEGKCVYLARYIMNPPKDMIVDHIDRNQYNNQRSNLRIGTRSQNQQNRAKQGNNTSGYKGVYWSPPSRKWFSMIGLAGKNIYLGLFECKHEAAMKYNQKAVELHGEFAVLNVIDSGMGDSMAECK